MELTADQKKAIENWARPTAIIAGAGTGKTEVLTRRLEAILKAESCNLNQILAIAFTEKSAKELTGRIAKILPRSKQTDLVWANIGTFHSFCLNLIRENAPLLGLAENVAVWDEHTADLAIHRRVRATLLLALEERRGEAMTLVEGLGFNTALELLEELMRFRWHAEKYLFHNGGEPLLRSAGNLYRQVLEAYTAEKKSCQALDFQDLEILSLNLLEARKEVLQNVRRRFRHILIDEVQDLNELQKELALKIFDPAVNCLCVVGDPKQSIYRFRGARVEGFQELAGRIRKAAGQVVELKENFRSRPAILDFINHAFEGLFPPQVHFPLKATRPASRGAGVKILKIPVGEKTTAEELRKKEASLIARWIRKMARGYGDFALLFQSLNDARHYTLALQEARIPCRIFGGRGFLNAQEIVDLLFCLKLSVNPDDRLALVGLLRSPLGGLPDTVITNLCLEHPSGGKAILEKIPELDWLRAILGNKGLSGAEILEGVLAKTGYDALLGELDPSGTALANCEQLIDRVRRLEISEGMLLPEILEYFEALKKRKAPLAPSPGVDQSFSSCQLMTIHAAKGLEFPFVILPDLCRGRHPGGSKYLFVREEGLGFYPEGEVSDEARGLKEKENLKETEERKRLLYVALTRAKEALILPFPDGKEGSGLWHNWLKEALAHYPGEGVETISLEESAAPPSEIRAKPFSRILRISGCGREKTRGAVPHFTVTELLDKNFGVPQTATSSASPRGLHGAALGNLVHGVLKNFQATGGEAPAGPMEDQVRRKLFDLEIRTTPEEREEAALLLKNFLQSNIAPPAWEGRHELPFQLKLSGAVVTGIIDYAWESPEGWILYDFKTDERYDPGKYRLQMDAYALALSLGEAKPLLRTKLLFLKSGKAFIEEWSPERKKRAEEELSGRIEKLAAKRR